MLLSILISICLDFHNNRRESVDLFTALELVICFSCHLSWRSLPMEWFILIENIAQHPICPLKRNSSNSQHPLQGLLILCHCHSSSCLSSPHQHPGYNYCSTESVCGSSGLVHESLGAWSRLPSSSNLHFLCSWSYFADGFCCLCFQLLKLCEMSQLIYFEPGFSYSSTLNSRGLHSVLYSKFNLYFILYNLVFWNPFGTIYDTVRLFWTT